MHRMRLILDFMSQPYLGFVQWLVRTESCLSYVVFVLWFYGGTLLYASGMISFGHWAFGEETWTCRIFIFGMSLAWGTYHFFYVFPRRFERQLTREVMS